MSRFVKALEQVERERANGNGARAPSVAAVEDSAVAAPAVVSSEEPRVSAGSVTRPERERVQHRRAPVVRPAVASANVDERLVSLVAPVSFEAEQYRTLRYIVEQLRLRADLRSIGISSPGTADGKSTTAINLAGALAQARRLASGIDADSVSLVWPIAWLNGGRGVADFVTDPGATSMTSSEQPSANISVIPSGARPGPVRESGGHPGPASWSARPERYDFVIVDTPPLMPSPTVARSRWVDG
jgi:Mrp family chromosome partitioning ATPase